jgi:hypothetical protein
MSESFKTKATRRRALLQGALLTSGLASVIAMPQSLKETSSNHSALDLGDPLARTKILAKIKGSIATETVYTFCRLHLYLWLNSGNLLPMLTMQNLAAASWRPLPNGHYAAELREVGVYTEFDGDDIVDTWLNPVTGEQRDVWQFASGPLEIEIGPDGIVTGAEATLKPKEMRLDVVAGKILAPTQSSFSFPNPFKPDKWPREAGEPIFYWDSHYFFAAEVSDILNPELSSAPSVVQFQNLVSFHPWLGMGTTPGRTWGKGLGTKLRSLDDLPSGARKAFELRTPEIFDIPNWTQPRIDFVEYMQKRGGRQPDHPG